MSVRCSDFVHWRHFEYDPELILQFRQNKTNKWETTVKANRFGSFLISRSTDIETHLLRNETCDYHMFMCTIHAIISIHLKTCKDDPYPSFRCQIIDGTNTTDSSKEVQLEITGKWDKIVKIKEVRSFFLVHVTILCVIYYIYLYLYILQCQIRPLNKNLYIYIVYAKFWKVGVIIIFFFWFTLWFDY